MKVVPVILALAAGNFLYQLIQTEPSWSVAIERSWFQGWAVVFYALIRKLND